MGDGDRRVEAGGYADNCERSGALKRSISRRQSKNKMKDLKEKAIRGGLARLCAQGANFVLRLVSLMVLARLLAPKDFGLVGMVTAFTGVLSFVPGLRTLVGRHSALQRHRRATFNFVLDQSGRGGGNLGLIAVAMAPAIAAF